MDEPNADAIRSLSTKWSLAADEKLLNLLQNTHQKIISKCQEANTKLEGMAVALNDASIHLQNVNNKFMALSNSQFIESRVYDDDSETDGISLAKEEVTPSQTDELTSIKNSLLILDRVHETTEILDDSDSDSDAEISVVLKLKDMYSQRPLPYIIGSQAWKNKWHAGLITEDSDSDSTMSKQDQIEVYSESETDNEINTRHNEKTISETSSSFASEQEATITRQDQVTTQQQTTQQKTPADVAAELARRLAGPIQIESQERDYLPPSTKKVYKPDQPVTGTIFSDEPPPLDDHHSSSGDDDDDDDIFAEINKHKPYQQQRNPIQPNFTDDLFGFNKQTYEENGVFSDIAPPNVNTPKPKTTLLDTEYGSKSLEENSYPQNSRVENQDTDSKKPIGGISLFGSNKESIGAAILKNRRKSSSSDDENDNDDVISNRNVQEKPKITKKFDQNPKALAKDVETPNNLDEVDKTKKEKDIFDDLFAKPKLNKSTKVIKDVKKETKTKENNVKDLFNDNIFDDIDDIFTNNIVISKTNKNNQKSIFDEDDLFNEIAESKSVKQDNKDSKDRKNIFDSDEELFSEVKPKEKEKASEKDTENNEKSKHDIVKSTINKNLTQNDSVKVEIETVKDNLFEEPQGNTKSIKNVKPKSIFDSDSDEDIFADIKITKNTKKDENNSIHNIKSGKNNLKPKTTKVQSPSLFGDDDDELFANTNKTLKSDNKELGERESKTINTNQNKDIPLEDDKQISDIIIHKKVGTIVEEETEIKQKDKEIVTQEDIDQSNPAIDVISSSDKTEFESYKDKPSSNIQEQAADMSTPENDKNILYKQSGEIKNQDVIEDTPAKAILKEQNIDINIQDQLQHTLISATKSQTSTFEDLFSEPPEFEKTAEPKRSKNVNALFDDDSDDEALFFKKNDVISDEKPEIFNNNVNFDLFVDEPPSIDVDFTTKGQSDNDLFSPNIGRDSEVENLITKSEDSNKSFNQDETKTSDSRNKNILETQKDMFSAELEKDLFKSNVNKGFEQKSTDTNLFEVTNNENIFDKHTNVSPIKDDSKKIGKLNTKNFNINVNALMPGASPKKIPKEHVIKDAEIESKTVDASSVIDDKQSEHRTDNTKIESKKFTESDKNDIAPKEFDADVEQTEYLDNKASKLRPRIQVKRRPSTRKARLEASRKSGIDFGDNIDESRLGDKTIPNYEGDNHNDITSQLQDKLNTDKNDKISEVNSNKHETENNTECKDKDSKTDNASKENRNKDKNDTITAFKDKYSKGFHKDNISDINAAKYDANSELDDNIKDQSNTNEKTTKIVYILNDEDIFSTPTNVESPKDITKIETLGNTYKKTDKITEKETKSSLFDDSDEELFKTNNKVTKNVNIFESDSEDELFKGKQKKERQNEQKKERRSEQKKRESVKVKESLFSDDDDDDDLFGVKNERSVSKQTVPSTSKEFKKSAEPVFDDPLSLLGED